MVASASAHDDGQNLGGDPAPGTTCPGKRSHCPNNLPETVCDN